MFIVHGQTTDFLPIGQDYFLFTVELCVWIVDDNWIKEMLLEEGNIFLIHPDDEKPQASWTKIYYNTNTAKFCSPVMQ